VNDPRRIRRVLAVKSRVRDALAGELVLADRARREAVEARDAAAREEATLRGRVTAAGEVRAGELSTRGRLVRLAASRVESAQEALAVAEARRAETQQALARSTREVRGLEVVAGRVERARQELVLRREQGQVEDLVARRHRMPGAGSPADARSSGPDEEGGA
jgi:hypothetical protein